MLSNSEHSDTYSLRWNLAWEFALNGRYEEALMSFDTLLIERRSYVAISTRGLMRLMTNDLDGALEDLQEARNLPCPPKVPVPLIGVIYWMQGSYELACEDWMYEISRRRSKEVTHCDAAGGVQVPLLLWWGSIHEGLRHWRKPAEEEMKNRMRTKQGQNNWPGMVVPFLFHKMSREKLLAHASSSYPLVQLKQQGQAQFYIAAQYLENNFEQHYLEQLSSVASEQQLITHAEYHLARYVLSESHKSAA